MLYIYHFSILCFHVFNLIILFIARLMAISAPMATINMSSRTTDYTAIARVAQKWLQLKQYWHYRFQSYCIRLQIKFRIRWSTSTLISNKSFFHVQSALRSPERCLNVPEIHWWTLNVLNPVQCNCFDFGKYQQY